LHTYPSPIVGREGRGEERRGEERKGKERKGEKRGGAGGLRREESSLGVAPHSIQVSSASSEIAIEALRNVQDALEVRHGEVFLFVESESLRAADSVLDL
jgi:hypothetical protein